MVLCVLIYINTGEKEENSQIKSNLIDFSKFKLWRNEQ